MAIIIVIVIVAVLAVFVIASSIVKSVVGICSAKDNTSENNNTGTSSAITKKGIAAPSQDVGNAFNGTKSGSCGSNSAAAGATSIQGHSHVTIQNSR